MLLDPRKHTTTSIKTSNGSDSSTEYVTVPRPIEDQNHKIDSETEVEEDEGDNGDSWRQHLPSSNKTITKSEPYTALLSVDCVECRIGDRIFRLNLPISGAGLGTEIKSEFREVFA